MPPLNAYNAERCRAAELAVVGAPLVLPAALAAARAYLTPERFHDLALGKIFAAMCALDDRKTPVDAVTVAEELRRTGHLDEVGGGTTLRAAIDAVADAGHAEHYAKIASGYFYERAIVQAARAVAMEQTVEHLEALRRMVLEREALGLPAVFNYASDLYDVLDKIEQRRRGRFHEVGLLALDQLFSGLLPGEVVTWGAATNIGKSLLLLNVASHCAGRGEAVLYVGTEMSAPEIVGRHLSILTAVEPHKIRTAQTTPEETRRLLDALGDRMSVMPMRILDLPEPSLSDVEAALNAARAQVVFLDYLERFRLPPGENYRLRVNEFMRRVKSLARRYDVVVHLASQLSREVYAGEERRPTLAHLSESSAIEKESDRVVLLWQPKAKNQRPELLATKGRVLEAVVAKNRHGRRGLVLDLHLDARSLRVTQDVSPPEDT